MGILATLVVMIAGLACGCMAATAVGTYPLMDRMNYRDYIGSVRLLWPRFDPVMPLLNVAATILNIVLACVVDGAARIPFALAALLLVLVMAVSVSRNVPINRMVTASDPDVEPADWAAIDPRPRWQFWNNLRTVLAIAGLAASAAGAVLVQLGWN